MLTIKIALLTFLVFASSAAHTTVRNKSNEQLDTLELKEIEPLSSKEAASVPKANWQPICQEVLINGLEAKPIIPESEVVFLPQEKPGIVISPGRSQSESCIAPNDGGITTFLREAYELLPHDRLNDIKEQAAKNPEVQKLANFLKSDSFRNQLNALLKTNAFVVFRDYACNMLYFNIDELLQFGENIFDLQLLSERELITKSHVAAYDLLSDIKDALPTEEFVLLFKKKLEQDEYLRKAKYLIKSQEFIGIVKAVKDQPEYVALIKSLKENGFNFDIIVEYARKIVEPDFESSVLFQ